MPSKQKIVQYEEAVAKGQKLLGMMLAGDKEAGKMLDPPQPSATSQFLELSSLSDWGYERTHSEYYAFQGREAKCLDRIGLPFAVPPIRKADGKWIPNPQYYSKRGKASVPRITDNHDVDTTHENMFYKHTNALFESTIDRQNGVLINVMSYNPAYKVLEAKKAKPNFPKLQRWSDMAYLQWIDPIFKNSPNDIQAVVQFIIENKSTVAIIDRVLSKYIAEHNKDETWLPDAAGITWDIEAEEAKALLGSPNGRGTGYLLAQHKHQLGWKTVSSVTLFEVGGDYCKGNRQTWSLCFHIKNVSRRSERLKERAMSSSS